MKVERRENPWDVGPEAEQEHVVKAPVRSRVVVPVQFVPNLIAALQEHMRVFSETYSNVGWTKADPIH